MAIVTWIATANFDPYITMTTIANPCGAVTTSVVSVVMMKAKMNNDILLQEKNVETKHNNN